MPLNPSPSDVQNIVRTEYIRALLDRLAEGPLFGFSTAKPRGSFSTPQPQDIIPFDFLRAMQGLGDVRLFQGLNEYLTPRDGAYTIRKPFRERMAEAMEQLRRKHRREDEYYSRERAVPFRREFEL